jgi:hypothetical protein
MDLEGEEGRRRLMISTQPDHGARKNERGVFGAATATRKP